MTAAETSKLASVHFYWACEDGCMSEKAIEGGLIIHSLCCVYSPFDSSFLDPSFPLPHQDTN